jgi:hypothetical protein
LNTDISNSPQKSLSVSNSIQQPVTPEDQKLQDSSISENSTKVPENSESPVEHPQSTK